MRWFLLCLLFLQVGCATKYILPANRFMTPESQGGAFRSSLELQQGTGNQLTGDLSGGSAKNGVTYSHLARSGFLFATSIFDQMDFFWNHVGSGNSLFGVKYQFMGASRTGNGTGHKMAVSAAFGGNKHETEGSDKVAFGLQGKEFQLLYGYRINEYILPYTNFTYGSYSFDGDVNSSDDSIDGLHLSYKTNTKTLLGGVELAVNWFMLKLECGYQQLKTTDTKDETHFFYGYSVGVTW